MSGTRVAVLTPPAAGAIATVAAAGPGAWDAARSLFRPAGKKPLPDEPPLHRFWFGNLGDGTGDEVVLAVREVEPGVRVEVHCHGGRRVVRWVVEQFIRKGCREVGWKEFEAPKHGRAWAYDLLPQATTLRTASILLDQHHSAFDRAVQAVLEHLDAGRPAEAAPPLADLARFAPLGRHLVAPWRVVVAGPPNVGKSSLVNALAGYQRSVVSDVAGTTRDVVTVPVAFDGWPVELADTAGLRRAAESLEAAGIDLARRFLAQADLVVWVLDATAAAPAFPEPDGPDPRPPAALLVVNKTDLPPAWDFALAPDARRVSAATGDGIPGLAAAIARTLVPHAPPPGAAVPFTPELADAVERAHAALAAGDPVGAAAQVRGSNGVCDPLIPLIPSPAKTAAAGPVTRPGG